MKIACFIVLLALCVNLSTQSSYPENKREVYCGRRLADVLKFVCSVFEDDSSKTVKRAIGAVDSNNKKIVKRDVGLHDLCCGEGCTILDIAEYC